MLQYYFIIFRSELGDDLINWNSGLSSVTSTRSKVKIKVTELPKFRKVHFSRSISSATLALSSKLMVDYDNMGPSLQLIGARFLNFLLSKLSRDFRLHGMSITGFQRAIFHYCLRLESRGQVCW